MKSEEIAKIAGVSRSTVSRVINNYPNVPEKTRERVMKIIREYNYEPNMSARVLAGKRTNTIGLFLFSIYDIKSPNRVYGNGFFSPFVDAFVDVGNSMGFYMLVHTIYKPEESWRIRQTFSQKRIDGGIIIGTEKSREMESILRNLTHPLVIMDYNPSEIQKIINPKAKIGVINSDDEKGIYKAVDYLVSLGHRRIGMILGRQTTYSGHRRRESFVKRMKFHGLPLDVRYIIKGDFTWETVVPAIENLIDSGQIPTGIIASNDSMAMAAIDTFKRHGIRVPEDVSVIGYDDFPTSAIVKPALTTVRIPFFEMAKKSMDMLSELIESDEPKFMVYNADTELVVRETCAKINNEEGNI
jgi:family./Bacterial regulatory proteins, lacI family.